jgi:tetratricopeptide (TPR) repeat protein
MNYRTLLLICLLFTTSIYGQNSSDEEKMFIQSRQLLAMRQIEEAIPSLETLYNLNPENANYNFLLGAAYRELGKNRASAIFHLQKAVLNITENYDASTYKEDKAPILTYYYLATAQVDNDQCLDAEKSLENLKKYGNQVDGYFIREIERNLSKCDYEAVPEVVKEEDLPIAELVVAPKVELKKEVKPADPIVKKDPMVGMVTKTISYTTKSPLWGVQIGAFSEVIPTSRFDNVKNVDAFVDKKGLIRYVVGHFSYKQQAESLLEVIKESGIPDAFIVDVNDNTKFNESIVSVNNINIKRGIIGKVTFKVQIGAFKKDVPQELANKYLTVDNIQEINYEGLTLLLVGNFENYDEALKYKDQLVNEGVNEAFIVAFNNGKKIPIKEAKEHSKK